MKKQKVKNLQRKLWFADKKLGTCYQVEATHFSWYKPILEDRTEDNKRYFVKPHNATHATVFKLYEELHTKRELAYQWLILSLSQDVEHIVSRIQRATSEI